jgi:hypothetical protein
MQYKDLIYKITSGSGVNTEVTPEEMKAETDINPAKKSVQIKDVLIGVMIDANTVLNKGISSAIKAEVERTLTVLFNSPISDTFSFLPFDKTTLIAMLDLFPDRTHHYVGTKEEMTEVKTLKQSKLNLKSVTESLNPKDDFAKKIDYLVTVNIDNIEPTLKAILTSKNVMVFPMTYVGTSNSSQKEKLVTPDPSGWVYNPANGVWTKSWGNDGMQELPSWKAPDDWNLK